VTIWYTVTEHDGQEVISVQHVLGSLFSLIVAGLVPSGAVEHLFMMLIRALRDLFDGPGPSLPGPA
jgi:hypothetical protein